MTSHLKTREVASVPLEVKAEGENGTFEGYGAIFGNLDRDGDVVSRGAFAESLKGRMPALLWQHNAKEPIGRFDVVREDEKGLYVKGRLSMVGRGREAYDLLKMGALDGLSIGFVTKEAARNATTGTRTIIKADLMEISLVTFPANELARISNVKSLGIGLPETPRDFERMLRANGISRSRAKAITAKGIGGFGGDVGCDVVAAIITDLKARQTRLDIKQTLTKKLSLGARRTDHVTFSPSYGRRCRVEIYGHQSVPSLTDLTVHVRYFDGEKMVTLRDYKPSQRFTLGPAPSRLRRVFSSDPVEVWVTNRGSQAGNFSVKLLDG